MSMRKIPALFGCDPEAAAVYVKDGKTYALPPYYFRKVLGVKASDDIRHPLFFKEDFCRLIEDGANFEFTIMPSHNPRDLFDRVQECAKLASERILQLFPDECVPTLQFLPTTNWEVERWKDMPEDFFMSTEFGCDPDEDVFDLSAKCQVIDASQHPERYCGGHIHISGSKMIAKDPHMAVKSMVISAGLASLAFSDVPDLERKRLFLYGRPGKFRIQNYGANNPFGKDYAVGIEYRTPSARWAGNWEIAKQVLKWAEIGIKNILETSLSQSLVPELENPAIEAILNADQSSAKQLLSYVESKL